MKIQWNICVDWRKPKSDHLFEMWIQQGKCQELEEAYWKSKATIMKKKNQRRVGENHESKLQEKHLLLTSATLQPRGQRPSVEQPVKDCLNDYWIAMKLRWSRKHGILISKHDI